jgi:23S rRNA (guanosine2251-2'-O)-methyltransferase
MLERVAQSEHHQGVVARVSPFPLISLTEILDPDRAPAGGRFLIILDNLTDPRNLGAIIRSALAVDVDAILLPKDRSAGPTPAVSKTSAGALEHSRLVRVTNVAATMRQLRDYGCWLYGLAPMAEQSIYAADLTGSVVLVIGGEQRGIRPLVKKNCDLLLSIPQSGRVESLNASVAAAIAMYEVYRQRLARTPAGHA